MPPKRAASPAKANHSSGNYGSVLAAIERTSLPKVGARPPTADGTNAEGLAFLAENAIKPGVISLPCGLQYKVIKASKQKESPSPKVDSSCDVHYVGTLINGTEFDKSKKPGAKGPAQFAPNKVIQAWTIAMQLMGEGDKWQLFAPSELCYGDAGRGQFIGPGDVLIFEMELLKVHGQSKPKPVRPERFAAPTAAPTAAPFAAPPPAAAEAVQQPNVKRSKLSAELPEAEEEASAEEQGLPSLPPPPPPSLPEEPPTAPPSATTENAPPNVPALPPPSKAPPAKLADFEEATNRAFDEGVDTTLEAMGNLLNKLAVPTLRQALDDLGLPTSGRKEVLSERLMSHAMPGAAGGEANAGVARPAASAATTAA